MRGELRNIYDGENKVNRKYWNCQKQFSYLIKEQHVIINIKHSINMIEYTITTETISHRVWPFINKVIFF